MSKDTIRRRAIERLERGGLARFPSEGRSVPNFRGAENAAALLRRLTIWRRARAIKCEVSAPQVWLRRAAIAEGKTLYLPIGNQHSEPSFLEVDPARLGSHAWRAVSLRNAVRYGRLVTAEQLPSLDLVITGALAVNRQGAMLGRGGGRFDLEYGLLRHLGKIREYTPVVTTVHSVQVIDERIPMRAHDVPVDFAVTPDNVIAAPSLYPRPRGVLWDLLSSEGAKSLSSWRGQNRERNQRLKPGRG